MIEIKSRLIEFCLLAACAVAFGVAAANKPELWWAAALLGIIVYGICLKMLRRNRWFRRLLMTERLRLLFAVSFSDILDEDRIIENEQLAFILETIVLSVVHSLLRDCNSLQRVFVLEHAENESKEYMLQTIRHTLDVIPWKECQVTYNEIGMCVNIQIA